MVSWDNWAKRIYLDRAIARHYLSLFYIDSPEYIFMQSIVTYTYTHIDHMHMKASRAQEKHQAPNHVAWITS